MLDKMDGYYKNTKFLSMNKYNVKSSLCKVILSQNRIYKNIIDY
jgi:hypothetical protein